MGGFTPAACSFPGEKARSWGALGEARPGQSSLSAGALRYRAWAQSWSSVKIAGRNINNLRYADDTTLMAESEEELKSLLMKVKVESEKVRLKLNIQKTSLAPHERLPEVLVVPREKTPISRGSQGLRSPLESRRGSLGAP